MPALSFKKQFANLVESGEKLQTIRAMRKRRFKVGDKLYLYTGMRTKYCRKLGESVAVSVDDIVIVSEEALTQVGEWALTSVESFNLAKADGFNSLEEFYKFFETNHGYFSGQLIKWEEVKK